MGLELVLKSESRMGGVSSFLQNVDFGVLLEFRTQNAALVMRARPRPFKMIHLRLRDVCLVSITIDGGVSALRCHRGIFLFFFW